MARRKKEEILLVERKHKVALMNKSEIYRYLKNEEAKKVRNKAKALFFAHTWISALTQAKFLAHVKSEFEVSPALIRHAGIKQCGYCGSKWRQDSFKSTIGRI